MVRKNCKRLVALAIALLTGLTPMGASAAKYGYIFGQETMAVGNMAGAPDEKVDMSMLNELTRDRDKTQAIVCVEEGASVLAYPEETSRILLDTYCAQTVYVDGVCANEDKVWIKIHILTNSGRVDGYLPETALFYTDKDLAKEVQDCYESAGIEEPDVLSTTEGLRWDIALFPASYQRKLIELAQLHPNWSFLPVNVNLDFNTVVYNETNPMNRNLVHKSRPDNWKRKDANNNVMAQPDGWAYPTEEVVRYCLDPRNFLNEQDIFMFEQLTLNKDAVSIEGLQMYLNNTFMAGLIPTGEFPYANVFYQVGMDLGVSPYHLASRVHQEQGAGTSPLISGKYPGYEGYYNYFNVGATGSSTQQIIINGLESAKKRGWNNPFTSIKGGAQVVCGNYVLRGQDTLYQQKFDVIIDPNTRSKNFPRLYEHQYMQNIEAPISEARKTYAIYKGANALTTGFIFKIPVYNNMPATTTGRPLSDVHAGEWYYDFVSYVYENEIMVGKAEGVFAPNDNVTRAEFATILYNAMGKPTNISGYQPYFFDVPAGTWYSDAVVWAYSNEICRGYGNGYFGVNDNITREQMIQMLYSLAIKKNLDLFAPTTVLDRFADRTTISSWAENAVAWGFQFGVMLGKNENMAPKDFATRAESATIIAKFLKLGK